MIVTSKKTKPTAVCAAIFTLALFTSIPSGQCRPVKTTHIVQAGESLASIADFYGVSQRDLLELNHLKKDQSLRVGRQLKIPNVLRVSGAKYIVQKGDTLATIAAKHNCSAKALARANKMKMNTSLTVGRTIVIPDRTAQDKSIQLKDGAPEPILFLRVISGESEHLQLFSDSGKVDLASVTRLSYLARDKKQGEKVKRLNFRLIKMLQLVAKQFPEKAVEIISGYRPQSDGNETQHAFGRAIDFRMPGVPLKNLFNFCKTLPRSGCGYYPNAGFIHMDAREKKTSWVDLSR